MDYVNEPSESHAQTASFWELAKLEIDEMKQDHNAFKTQDLPLARIKKIMKLDDDVKAMMISAEAPILFAKAAELFIRELTLRAWLHTERNRRRTLQRNDVAMAVSDSDTDQFDFLIDIVPREEARGHRRYSQSTSTQQSVTTVSPNNSAAAATATIINNVPSLNTGQKLDYKTVTIPATNGVSATADGIVVSPTPSATAAAMQQSAAAVIGQANNPMHSAAGTIATGPIQYVLQLPASAAAAAPGQSFQLQVLPQQFQTTADGTTVISQPQVVATAGGAGGLQVLQVIQPTTVQTSASVNAASGVGVANASSPVSGVNAAGHAHDANGAVQRVTAQTLQIQMPESAAGRQMFQQSQSTTGGTVLLNANGQQIAGATVINLPGGGTGILTGITTDSNGQQQLVYTPVTAATTSAATANDVDAHHQVILQAADVHQFIQPQTHSSIIVSGTTASTDHTGSVSSVSSEPHANTPSATMFLTTVGDGDPNQLIEVEASVEGGSSGVLHSSDSLKLEASGGVANGPGIITFVTTAADDRHLSKSSIVAVEDGSVADLVLHNSGINELNDSSAKELAGAVISSSTNHETAVRPDDRQTVLLLSSPNEPSRVTTSNHLEASDITEISVINVSAD